MISEFYWYHKHFKVLDSNLSKLSSTAYMNKWTQRQIGEAKAEGNPKARCCINSLSLFDRLGLTVLPTEPILILGHFV